VAFESLLRSQADAFRAAYAGIDFPYVEGLRLDEAMHPLALSASACTGKRCRSRMARPFAWCSLEVRLQEHQIHHQNSLPVDPSLPSTWNRLAPNEYGFYSNVNPNVDHPRWSQAKERRLGEFLKRNTLLFNGYGDQVASLYNGMDLKKNF
jgi:sulfoxide reductase catalytic subunit YedY